MMRRLLGMQRIVLVFAALSSVAAASGFSLSITAHVVDANATAPMQRSDALLHRLLQSPQTAPTLSPAPTAPTRSEPAPVHAVPSTQRQAEPARQQTPVKQQVEISPTNPSQRSETTHHERRDISPSSENRQQTQQVQPQAQPVRDVRPETMVPEKARERPSTPGFIPGHPGSDTRPHPGVTPGGSASRTNESPPDDATHGGGAPGGNGADAQDRHGGGFGAPGGPGPGGPGGGAPGGPARGRGP